MFSGLLQPMHLILILGVVLIVFGPGKLANLGQDLGKAVRDFKSAMEEHNVTPTSVADAARPAGQPLAPAVEQTAARTVETVEQAAAPAKA